MFSSRPKNAISAKALISRIEKIAPPVLDFGKVARLSLDDATKISLALQDAKALPKTILLNNIFATDKIAVIITILSGLEKRCLEDYKKFTLEYRKRNYNIYNEKQTEQMAKSIILINLKMGVDRELLMDHDEKPTTNAKQFAKLYDVLRKSIYIFQLPQDVVSFFNEHQLINSEEKSHRKSKARSFSLPNIHEKTSTASCVEKKPEYTSRRYRL